MSALGHNAAVLVTKGIGGFANLIKQIGTGGVLYNLIDRYFDALEDTIANYASIDAAAAKFVQATGGGARAIQAIADSSLKAAHDLEISKKYNVSTEKLIEAQSNYIQAIGRRVDVSMGRVDENGNIIAGTSEKENLAAMVKVLGEATTPLLEGMDLFGVSINDASKRAAQMHNTASKAGISFSKYSDTVVKNFSMAQKYTFKDGLRGLESMAKKATEMKFDMSQVAAYADSVGNLEKSVNVASRLQVLGGPFAQFADPLSMLNESLLDMEGAQDRIMSMFKSLGNFNKQTGEVEIGAFERMQIREASQAMGLDYGNVLNMIQTGARRDEIESQINNTAGSGAFTDDFKDLIKNIGKIENGEVVVTSAGKDYTLDELAQRPELMSEVMAVNQDESKDIKDIAMSVRSIEDEMKGFLGQVKIGQAYSERFETYIEGGRTTVERIMDIINKDFEDLGINANILGRAGGVLKNAFSFVLEKLAVVGPVLQAIPQGVDAVIGSVGGFLQNISDSLGLDITLPDVTVAGVDNTTQNAIGNWGDYLQGLFDYASSSQANSGGVRRYSPISPEVPVKEMGGFIGEGRTYGNGGPIFGKTHASGGEVIEAERGEFVVNRKAMQDYGPIVEAINNQGRQKYEFGGMPGGPSTLGSVDLKDWVFNLDSDNSAILRGLYVTVDAINKKTPEIINATPDNVLGTNKVKPTETDVYTSSLKENVANGNININIKLSDLNVRGDMSKSVDMQKLANDPQFVDAILNIVKDAVSSNADKSEAGRGKSDNFSRW